MFNVIKKTYTQAKAIAREFGKECVNIVFHGTGLSIREHQRRTVENFLLLRGKCNVPIVPVVQGFTVEDYHYCIDLYAAHGVDLRDFPTVGVGSKEFSLGLRA